MIRFLLIIMAAWKHKAALFLPLLLLPTLGVFYSMGQPPLFEATTVMHLDTSAARSPLLKNMEMPAHQEMLQRTLTSSEVLQGAAEQAGLMPVDIPATEAAQRLSPLRNHLHMEIMDGALIKLSYKTDQEHLLLPVLEAVSSRFVEELVAPERFRIEQQLGTLAEQIQYYTAEFRKAEERLAALEKTDSAALKNLVAAEFEAERLKAQKELAQEEYDHLLKSSQTLMSFYNTNPAQQALWYVEAPVVTQSTSQAEQNRCFALWGLGLAVVWAFSFMLAQALQRKRALHNETQVKQQLGTKVLGTLPNMGEIKIEQGRLNANIRTVL